MHDIAAAAASPVFGVPFSVLDVAPVSSDRTASEALADSTALVVEAERLGYHRLWYAEHHNMPGIASSAPEVLIANAGARTSRIRLGSGGVMLPNHAPLVVAERFGTLQALFPGRIDLGIGRAPGTDQRTASALRRLGASDDLPELLHELFGYFQGFAPDEDYRGIRAIPGFGADMPAVWLLGSSGFSAQVAGVMGLPFAFAHHFSAQNTLPALELYRRHFQPSRILDRPYPMVTAMAVVAPTDEEANLHASAIALSFARMRSGYPPAKLPTIEEVEAHPWTPQERAFVEGWLAPQVIGSPETVHARLDQLIGETGVSEFMVTTNAPAADVRTRSYQLLAELAELPAG